MSFKEFYQSRRVPRSPVGWRFCSLAVTDFVVLSDEINTTAKWRALSAAQLNDPKYPRPTRRDSFRDAHLIDIPRDSDSLSPTQAEQRYKAIDAFEYAFSRLGESAEAGLVSTACRAKSGGGLEVLQPSAWGIDDFWNRFAECALCPDAPFEVAAEPTHWIFFEQDALYWLIDNERLRFGLEPRYQRRFAPSIDRRADDPYPGKDEVRRLTSAWFAIKNGDTKADLPQQTGIISCAALPVPVVERGAPGRPTSRQVILRFLDERIASGDVESTLAVEAEALHLLFTSWRNLHPANASWPTVTLGSTKNIIRDKYKAHKSKSQHENKH